LSAPIVSGIQYESHLIELLCTLFGDGWFEGGVLKVKYPRPVLTGEAVRPFAKVTALTGEGTVTSVELDVWCTRADGEKVLVGAARCRIVSADAATTR
jgi:acyl dehydratase